jgi:hypothetical protein
MISEKFRDKAIYYKNKLGYLLELNEFSLWAKYQLNKSKLKKDYKDGLPVDLSKCEIQVYAQHGEDGIIAAMVSAIGCKSKFIVEFGVENAKICNARTLVKSENWDYLLMDGDHHADAYMEIKKEFITSENINNLFEKYDVPKHMGILSVDIDYNTYWVYKAIKSSYTADILIVEYNASLPSNVSLAVQENNARMWDYTNYFGASLLAFTKLLAEQGYTLVYCENSGTNAFFVRNEYKNLFVIRTFEEIYRAPGYGKWVNGKRTGHPQSNETYVEV